MLKKFLALILTFACVITVFSSCGLIVLGNKTTSDIPKNDNSQAGNYVEPIEDIENIPDNKNNSTNKRNSKKTS